MDVTAQQVVNVLERFAPPILAFENDKIGLQLGRLNRPVHKVWLALDPSPAVVKEAIDQHADMLVTHHAMLFHPLLRIDTATARGKAMALALAHDLTVYNAHTNLDVAEGGVNDVLAQRLGLQNTRILDVTYRVSPHTGATGSMCGQPQELASQVFGMGRMGRLAAPVSLLEFAVFVRDALTLAGIRYVGDPALVVNQVAVVGGSGGRWMHHALVQGADVMVTSDCDHHTMAEAWQEGLAVVEATHAAMERPVLKWVQKLLHQEFGVAVQVHISNLVEDPYLWA
ncbi:Nif3-like dinuclear metal center hexameric protein [Alicyclobacillaceae bacterium I2511]|nr:Nif3-like dinuclear metal center hexameric protein [Alicyclobacillaceae bacterium I2511]